jgi:hypothetical protein
VYFERQLKACDEIFNLVQRILPPFSSPDMDWGDAIERMADQMELVEGEARKLYTTYFSVLPDEIVTRLTRASAKAGSAKFEVEDDRRSIYGRTLIEEAYDNLREGATLLKDHLNGQRHSLVVPALQQQAPSREKPHRTG